MSVLAPKQKRLKSEPKAKEKINSKKQNTGAGKKESQQQNALGNRFVESQIKARQKQHEAAKDAGEKSEAQSLSVAEKSTETKEKKTVPDILSSGNSEEMISHFSEASASDMAAVYPQFGEKVTVALNSEQEKEKASLPELVASSELQSEAQKEQKVKASSTKKSKQEEIKVNKEPPPLQNREESVTQEALPSNQNVENILSKGKDKGFFSWLKENFSSFIAQIKTTNEHLSTSTGTAPSVTMQGKADKQQLQKTKTHSQEEVSESKKNVTEELIANKGQSKIKAVRVHEKNEIPMQVRLNRPPKIPQNEGMKAYLGIELSEDVRKHADALLKPAIEKSTEVLKARTQKAKKEKEQQKQKEMQKSQLELQRLNKKANEEQAKEIRKGRESVVKEQQQGINEAQKSVEKFNTEIKSKEKQSSKEVDKAVSKANQEAQKTIQEGEREAQAVKKEKEKEAEAKKQALAEKKKKRSLWDRTVDVVKSAVQLVTKAIDRIFTVMRKLVKTVIEKAKNIAVKLINKARAWVVERLEKFRTWAKFMVDKYLKTYFPNLAKKINKLIDKVVDLYLKVVNKIADLLIKGVELFAKGLGKILDKVLSIYQTVLKTAVALAGAVLTGDFAEALKIAIQAACDIAGVDSKPVFDFFKKAGKLILKILKDPVSFFKNLVHAVAKGIQGFQKNIVKHLKAGLIGWLTGTLSETEIELPEKFDFKGILSLVMQILGLTYKNIKARIIKKYPKAEKVFDKIEKGFTLIKEVLAGGVVVLWKKIKEKIGNLKEMVFSAIQNFVIFSVIKSGVMWLLSLLNPAAAIAKVMKLLFDFVMFLVERFTQIKDFVLSVYGSVASIASGSFAKASKAVEAALAKSVPVVISMLATVIGLGGIGKTIQKLIKKVSAPINKVIDKVIDDAVKFAKKLFGKFGGRKKNAEGKEKKAGKKHLDQTLGEKMTFFAGKENHRLWITNVGARIKVMVASEEGLVEKRLNVWSTQIALLPKEKHVIVNSNLQIARKINDMVMVNAFNEQMVTLVVLQDKVLTEEEIKAEHKAEEKTIQAEKALEIVLKVLFNLFNDIDTGKVFDIMLRERSTQILNEMIQSEPYKTFEKKYRETHKKGYVDNHIGVIRQKVQSLIGAYLRKGDIATFDAVLKAYFIENLEGKSSTEHTKYNPKVREISVEGGQFIVNYSYDPTGDKKKDFKVYFDFSQVSDSKKGVVTQRTEGIDLKLKEQGTRGKTESSGKLLYQSNLYRQFLESKGITADKDLKEKALKEMVSKIGMEKFIEYIRKKVSIQDNPELKNRADKLKKTNLFDSAHIVADWFGGSGYRNALNLTATSAEYNRIVMGDAEKSIAGTVKAKSKETLFNLNVEAKWDYLEDNEIIRVVTEKSMMQKISSEVKNEEVDQRVLAKDAKSALDEVLLKKQDPRRVLSVDYDGFIQPEQTKKLKEKIGCDIWMSSYFDFDKNSDTACKA